MRLIPTTLMAGFGVIAFAGAVAAQGLPTHTMSVRLPDGTLEQITYSGSQAPNIAFLPAREAALPDAAFWNGPDSPFALIQQISAAMDRQAAMMLRQAEALSAAPLAGNGTIPAALANLPSGAQSYSMEATITPGGVCSRSVEITSRGPDARPQIVSHSSGSCGSAGAPPTAIAAPDRAPAMAPAYRAPLYSAAATQAAAMPDAIRVASLH